LPLSFCGSWAGSLAGAALLPGCGRQPFAKAATIPHRPLAGPSNVATLSPGKAGTISSSGAFAGCLAGNRIAVG
jgi:hypothetical protein